MLFFRAISIRNFSRINPLRKRAKNAPLLISSKRPNYNHYVGQRYEVYDNSILVSDGWNHRKSKEDYFIIHPHKHIITEKEAEVREEFTFKDLNINDKIIEILSKHNINTPTTIQLQSIPFLLSGNNALIVAETGCGKTLAYLIPIIDRILKIKAQSEFNENTETVFNDPYCVILAPSRELVLQIGNVIQTHFSCLGINVEVLPGGIKKLLNNPPVSEVDILVSTISGINTFLALNVYKTSRTQFVIGDEADTLMDDSFTKTLSNVLKHYQFRDATFLSNFTEKKKDVQLVFVSATMPIFMPDWLMKFVNPDSLKRIATKEIHQVLPNVKQCFLRISKAKKAFELLKLVKEDLEKNRSTMIFSNNTKTADWISFFLNENGVRCYNLNAEVPLPIRKMNLEQFKNGIVKVISCTDIASRGLDMINVSHIINYDFPTFMADYIHRCGRTGRIGSPDNCKVTNLVIAGNEVKITQEIEMSVRKMENLPNVDGNIKYGLKMRQINSMENN